MGKSDDPKSKALAELEQLMAAGRDLSHDVLNAMSEFETFPLHPDAPVHKWSVRCLSALKRLFGDDSVFFKKFQSLDSAHFETDSDVEKAVGILEIAYEDLANGKAELSNFVPRVQEAEAFPARQIAAKSSTQQSQGNATAEGTESESAEGNAFRKAGDTWTVSYKAGSERGLKDLKGMGHIATLLRTPNKTLSGTDLRGDKAAVAETAEPQELFDDGAREKLEKRLEEINKERAEAKKNNDAACFKSLDEEVRGIESALKNATGLGGRAKTLGQSAARKDAHAVRGALKRAYESIARHCPDLATHLENSIAADSNGFVYRPDEDAPPWQLR